MMYFVKTLFPLRLCTFYPYPTEAGLKGPEFIGGAIFFLATIGLAIWSMRKTRVFAFGFGWILATVLLVLQFISVGVVIMADRYFYLPSAGLFFMLTYAVEVYVLQNKPGLRNAWWGMLALFAAWCLWLSRTQTATWKNSETLWQQVLKYYPLEDQAMESLKPNKCWNVPLLTDAPGPTYTVLWLIALPLRLAPLKIPAPSAAFAIGRFRSMTNPLRSIQAMRIRISTGPLLPYW
jgi:hypothetical protein